MAAEVPFVVADCGVGGDAADAAAVVGRGGAQAQAAHRREGQRPRASVHVHRRLCKRGEGKENLSINTWKWKVVSHGVDLTIALHSGFFFR